jgi:hypothetical protein
MARAGVISISKTQKEDPYMIEEETVKTLAPNNFVNINAEKRNTFGLDQRGSTNTTAIQRRQKMLNSRDTNSVAAPSVASICSSHFSFHPEINRSSMWKPKYDDHHDHEKMWKRMHGESKKIETKKRIMSQEKDRQELAP